MSTLCQQVPVLPETLALYVSQYEVLLPGCSALFPGPINFPFPSNVEDSTIIGIAVNSDVGTVGTAAYTDMLSVAGVTLSGICRFRIQKVLQSEPFYIAEVTQIDKHDRCNDLLNDPFLQCISNQIMEKLQIVKNSAKEVSVCFLPELYSIKAQFKNDKKLILLNKVDLMERFKYIVTCMRKENEVKDGHRFYEALPFTKPSRHVSPEMTRLQNQIKKIKFPHNAKKAIFEDLENVNRSLPIGSEHRKLLNYLSLVAKLPWDKYATEDFDVNKARQILDSDHYGLQQVKRRVLEYLAVRNLRIGSKRRGKTPILCLIGPPGVGKTSIVNSIATAMNRPHTRISLAGIADLNALRGHCRTYVGAMPGLLINAMSVCGVKNPIILLDEIDKLGTGSKGCPASALLEILDPEQNNEYIDSYLNIPFDLSSVMFIATANCIHNIPATIADRLEIIQISGYNPNEKLHIAMKHLIPNRIIATGLTPTQIEIPEETVRMIIRNYTEEPGVRSLGRKIEALCRYVTVKLALKRSYDTKEDDISFLVDIPTAKRILGPTQIDNFESLWLSPMRPGVAFGMAVNMIGGGVIFPVECSFTRGTGSFVVSGSVGSIFKESSNLAWAWIRTNFARYAINLDKKRLDKMDVFVNCPAAAIQKDGPSAGITIVAALMSMLLNQSMMKNVAMTGEITLHGNVLPVGGILEKVTAAHTVGFTKVILPRCNEKLIRKISKETKKAVKVVFVSHINEVLEEVFEEGFNLLVNPTPKL